MEIGSLHTQVPLYKLLNTNPNWNILPNTFQVGSFSAKKENSMKLYPYRSYSWTGHRTCVGLVHRTALGIGIGINTAGNDPSSLVRAQAIPGLLPKLAW
jgi:hypothetical protein